MPEPKPIRVEIVARPLADKRSLAALIRRVAAARPATRSAEAAVAGAVVIAVLPALLPKLVELLNSWMALRKGRSVRVKVSRGDASIEVEFPPGERGGEEILDFVDGLGKRLEKKQPKRRP
jgi:hypothetical protein